jgi:hypothetical protein
MVIKFLYHTHVHGVKRAVMKKSETYHPIIPVGLQPYFQEYDVTALDLHRDANLIIQRTLEFGTWEEVRWLFSVLGTVRVRLFLRQYGERWLKPANFNYWRKLLRIRKWRRTPFPTAKGEVWNL